MAYSNFQPTIFAEKINRELERYLVFAEDCNRKYEGQVSSQGERVKILGVGKPTITTVTKANRNNDIGAAETIEDTSSFLDIDQIRYYHYKVGDIDKQFSVGGFEEAIQKETAQAMANAIDSYIAKLTQLDDAIKHQSSSVIPLVSQTTSAGILRQIDDAVATLWGNDVPQNEELTLTMTPRAFMILKQAYTEVDTNNSEMLKNGYVGKYGTVRIKVSNNVATLSDAGATDFCLLRTKNAIAYVHPLTVAEAYRPDLSFSDALKGFSLFGAKIVRPKELIVLNWKYA